LKSVRRRYLAIEIDVARKIEERELKNAVWNAVGRLFGEYGASKTDFVLIRYDATENFAVFRCANASVEAFRASLALITEIGQEPVTIHVLGVSGTLKSLKGRYPNVRQ